MSIEKKDDVAVYIDYDNLFRSIKESYGDFTGTDVVKKIIKYLTDEDYNVGLVKAFCDFKTSYQELDELQNNLFDLRHINSVGNGKNNASDIGLAIDVMKSLYNNRKFENYVLVSSDSDMLPLISELRYAGKNVYLFYLKSKISNKYIDILIENNNIKLKSIEDILEIGVHNKITVEFLEGDLTLINKYLNTISNKIQEYVKRYGEEACIYSKGLIESLVADHNDIQESDASVILGFLKNKKYIVSRVVEVEIDGNKVTRNTQELNKDKIAEDGIELNELTGVAN